MPGEDRKALDGGSSRLALFVLVAQHTADGFHIHAVLEGQGGEGVPIGYNKDKSEIPLFARGWRFVHVLFPSIFPQKIGIAWVAKK